LYSQVNTDRTKPDEYLLLFGSEPCLSVRLNSKDVTDKISTLRFCFLIYKDVDPDPSL